MIPRTDERARELTAVVTEQVEPRLGQESIHQVALGQPIDHLRDRPRLRRLEAGQFLNGPETDATPCGPQ